MTNSAIPWILAGWWFIQWGMTQWFLERSHKRFDESHRIFNEMADIAEARREELEVFR